MWWLGMMPWLCARFGTRHRRWAWLAVILCAALPASWLAIRAFGLDPKAYGPEDSCDVPLILQGIHQAPTFADTARWWTGTWAGQVPFWRPLSSLLFWAEWHLFGEQWAYYMVVSAVLGVLLAAVTFWALLPLLGEGKAAAVVIAVFCNLVVPWERQWAMMRVLIHWKNQPDLLAGLGILAAVGLAVRGRLPAALLAATWAVCSKEIGFCAFALMPMVLVWRQVARGQRSDWPRVVFWCAVCAAALSLYHYHAVGVGYTMGTNRHWLSRAFHFYAGCGLGAFFQSTWYLAFLAPAYAAILPLCPRRPLMALLLVCAATAGVALLLARVEGDPFTLALVRLFTPPRLIPPLVAWWCAAAVAWRHARAESALGIGWAFLGAAPTFAATQTGPHTLWLGEMGHSIVAAGVLAALWGQWGRFGTGFRRRTRFARKQQEAA